MKRRVRVLRLLPHIDHDPLVGRWHQLDPLLRWLLDCQLLRDGVGGQKLATFSNLHFITYQPSLENRGQNQWMAQ